MRIRKVPKDGKVQEVEEQAPNDELIFEPTKYDDKPESKVIRKKIVDKNGKEEEVEEEPGKNVIYKTAKCGPLRSPQTKIIRKRTITKDGKDNVIEEDLPGDEVVVRTIKYGKEPNAQKLKKVIIVKDGKNQEIEEEVPLEEYEPEEEQPKVKAYKELVKNISKGIKGDKKPTAVLEPQKVGEITEIKDEEKKPKEELKEPL